MRGKFRGRKSIGIVEFSTEILVSRTPGKAVYKEVLSYSSRNSRSSDKATGPISLELTQNLHFIPKYMY